MIIGISVVFFLIVPTVKTNIRKEYAKEELDYSSQLNVQLATINSKEKEIETLTTKLEETERKLADALGADKDNKVYDNLFSALTLYLNVKENNKPSDEELLEVAKAIYPINPEKLTSKDAKEFYDMMKNDIYPSVFMIAFEHGKEQFDAGDYEKALELLLEAYAYNPVYDNTLYYLGQAYQEIDDIENAKKYYNELLENCPDSSLKDSTNTRLNSLQ